MAVAEGGRVADVHADRLPAVGVADGAQPLADLAQCGVPGDLLERPVRAPAQRMQHTVVVVLIVDEFQPLRAGEARGDRVPGVGPQCCAERAEAIHAAIDDGAYSLSLIPGCSFFR